MYWTFCLIVYVAIGSWVPKPTLAQSNAQRFSVEIENYFNFLELPGLAIGVAEGDSIVFFKGLGYADIQQATSITEDHIFWIASITKTFSAVALKQWEEEGRISLDDPIQKYPNNYFQGGRLRPEMTIEHLISHTSESEPIGQQFVYNGGRYNVIFNVFDEISPSNDAMDLIRPFTFTIDEQIINPLELRHTFTRSSGERFESAKALRVTPYSFRSSSGTYVENSDVFNFETSYPSTGMLSSVSDLVRYSSALDEGQIISPQGYKSLTAPYYESPINNSPYGLGWFTSTFEGMSMHWGYGYGAADAALLLKMPAKKLTLVALSNAAMPSGSVRLGNGNPLNSIVVISFLKHFVFEDTVSQPGLDFTQNLEQIEQYLRNGTERTGSNLYLEEAYAYVMMMQFVPEAIYNDTHHAGQLLRLIHNLAPEFINPSRRDAFELLATFEQPEILAIGSELVRQYKESSEYDPIKSYYSGEILEKSGNLKTAREFYEQVADTEAFLEQPVKHKACLWLGKYFQEKDRDKATYYLEKLLKYKELSGENDAMTEEARTILDSLL